MYRYDHTALYLLADDEESFADTEDDFDNEGSADFIPLDSDR